MTTTQAHCCECTKSGPNGTDPRNLPGWKCVDTRGDFWLCPRCFTGFYYSRHTMKPGLLQVIQENDHAARC